LFFGKLEIDHLFLRRADVAATRVVPLRSTLSRSGKEALPLARKVALHRFIVAASFPFIRRSVASMQGYVPGEQPRDRRYIKLNTNENPYPPSPKVHEALHAAVTDDLRLYPDPLATELRQRAAEVYGVPVRQIIVGNGSDDLLTMLFRACVDGPGQVAYPVPTYSLYDTLALIQGATPTHIPFAADGSLSLDAVEALVLAGQRLIFICNPNAPTGAFTPLATVRELARRARGLVVVDEAYIDFTDHSSLSLLSSCPNVVVLRSFSKSFSLAGMRVGLGFGSAEVIAELFKVKDSYNLDRLSLVAARAALDDYGWMQANVARVRAARDALVPALRELGLEVAASHANFVLARTASGDAAPLYEGLKARGILVRYFAHPLLRDALRISVGTPEDNAALLDALRTMLS
jgi:histidinol-phosphate aminotransferase